MAHRWNGSQFSVEFKEPQPPFVPAWRAIPMLPDFSGQWLVAGDLDGDGELEFVAARNEQQSVTAMSAYKLDGSVLWTWGEAGAGSSKLSYDVPVQVYDIDGDGRQEVLFSATGYLGILEGATGREIQRYPLPDGLGVADCITFANLRGGPRAEDILIKTRYTKLWAYTSDWRELWQWESSAPHKTCHHPTPVDLDSDGCEEVLAGYTMLDQDGRELWTMTSNAVDLSQGHLDCCRIVRMADTPEGFRFAVTCCGANLVALIDGEGRTIWEIPGHHFESLRVAPMRPNLEGAQIFVDIDHRPYGESPTWLLNRDGRRLGTYTTNYSRHHAVIDWDGNGMKEIVFANALTLADGHGNHLASFDLSDGASGVRGAQSAGDPGPLVTVTDVDGDGVEEVVLHTDERVFVYRSERPAMASREAVSGTVNFTLY